MIPSQFYPDDTTISVPPQGFTVTESINNISYGSNIDDPLRPYTMGYIKYEDYPNILDLTKITPVYSQGSENKIVLESSTIPSNMPWGYVARTDSVFEHYSRSLFIYRDNDVWRPQFHLTNTGVVIGNVRMINAGYLATYTVTNYIRYRISISLTYDDSTAGNGTALELESTIQNFIDFCNGDVTLDFVYNNSQYNISIDDFDERGYVVTRNPEDTGDILIAISAVQWLDRGCGNGQGGNTQILPYIAVPTEEGIHYEAFAGFPSGDIDIRLNVFTGNQPMDIYMSTTAGAYGFTRLYGASGTLKYDDTLSWAKAYNTQEWHYIPQLNMFRGFTGGNTFRLYPIFPPMQIKALLELRLKTIKSLTAYASYAPANHIYDSDINTNKYDTSNVPTGDILNGTYNEIVAELRPWQLWQVDITVNNFNPDDIPPYKPTPGDDEDNTESGDKVPNQFGRSVGVTSNFVTNYLMTEGQISKLGEVLWTSWADDTVTMDMVNNFYGKFHDATGSWNVSDALQFIVSCRLFPCSLATLVDTTQVSSIPIGTGAFALQCGTQAEPNFFIANEATAILNCGDLYVPREYNDYRDFENTKITAYLPFCGSVELNPQDVVGKWLGCTYAIDLFDGSCKAFIYTLSGNDVGYEGAYYNVAIKQGQCGFLIPMSATQAGQVASRQKVDGYTDGALLYQAAAGLMESAMALGGYSDANPVAGFNKMITAGTASSVLTAQRLGRAGISAPSTSGGSGFTDFHQPASAYVQIRRSYYQEPLQYERSIGYPTNGATYDNLSQFTGFVKCVNVDLSGFTCHEDERSEIKALLESGVYL